MVCDEIIATLRSHRADLDSMGISRLAIFGSFARGEERAGSDVDILVDFNGPVSIFKFLDVKERLETLLGRPVDLVTRDALKPQLRDRILAEAVSAN
jgi:predicted nucleotidyltransferase